MTIDRIIHVSSQDPFYKTGGQGVTVENQCRQQMRLGYDVWWISCRIQGFAEYEEIEYNEGKLKVLRISCFDSDKISTPYEGDEIVQYKRRQEFGRKFVRVIKDNFSPQDSFIHLHGFYYIPLMAQELKEYNTCSQYHLLLTRRMKRTRGIREKKEIYSLIYELEKESLRINKKILAISNGFRQEMIDICPEARDNIWVMPNGIESRYVEAPFYPRREKFRVLSWGRISPEKNFESLMMARAYIDLPIDYLIFGRTDDTEGSRKRYHQRLLSLSRGKKNLMFIASHEGIQGEEKVGLIDSASLVVVPSLYETFGLVIIEAMARGKPVIASPTAGPIDIMQAKHEGPNDFGYICKPTPQNIARAIEVLYRNPELYEKMSANCKERAKDFLWHKLIYNLLKIYKI